MSFRFLKPLHEIASICITEYFFLLQKMQYRDEKCAIQFQVFYQQRLLCAMGYINPITQNRHNNFKTLLGHKPVLPSSIKIAKELLLLINAQPEGYIYYTPISR